MCIIAISKAGNEQPSLGTLRICFRNNPHGAGYMFARKNQVIIRKGFMTWADFATSVRSDHLTAEDSAVYHFRIATQAGVQPAMTHPFPLTRSPSQLKLPLTSAKFGIAHNGVIRLTTDPTEKEYSDTALYVMKYLAYFVRFKADLRDPGVLKAIEETAGGRWAIMDGSGYIATVGNFITGPDGNLYSNSTYRDVKLELCLR